MMRTAISSVLLALVLGAAHAQQLDCKPASPQAITGNSNPAGKWAAWHCNGHVQIVVCATGHCTDAVINAAWWVWDRGATLADGNAALTKYKAGSICDPSVRAVWWPDRYKLREQFGMSDAQVAAICTAK